MNWDEHPTRITIELFESPKTIVDTTFGLENEPENAKRLAYLKAQPDYKQVGEYQGTLIYKSGDFYFSEYEGRLMGYMARIETKTLPGDSRYVTQIALWRKPIHSPEYIAGYVFWTLLFPLHGAIMTDSSQTRLGKRFWEQRVGDALTKSLFVYLLDTRALTAKPIRSAADYTRGVDSAYGNTDRHKDYRLLITDKALSSAFTLQEVVAKIDARWL